MVEEDANLLVIDAWDCGSERNLDVEPPVGNQPSKESEPLVDDFVCR
jgi:hypothetical protein